MAQEDYYKVLGVARDADQAAIKDAYRRLAMKYHPDKTKGNKEDEQKFKEINEAFSVLGDKDKRANYDNFGHTGANGQGQWSGNFSDFGDLGDIFNSVFGGKDNPFAGGFGGGNRKRRADDQQYQVSIDFEEAYHGCERNLNIKVQDSCSDCKGNGSKEGKAIKDCLLCGGSGMRVINRGFMQVQQTCSNCHGKGKIIEEPCDVCSGSGRIPKAKKIEIKIPAGIFDGDKMIVRGEATDGDLLPGDVYVWVKVKPHSFFERDGADLICEMPVDVFEASLGSEMKLPTMNGNVSIKIPAGTQNGKVLRLRGKGMPRVNSSYYGDILVSVRVETPINLSKKQSQMIRDLRTAFDKDKIDHSPDTSKWKDKLKSLFQ